MESAFEQTEENLKEHTKDHPEMVELSGCTGSVLLVVEDYFVVANAGDSPIVIFRQDEDGRFRAEQLSIDHKPEIEEERIRILERGGVLDQHASALTGKKLGPLRVWCKHVR
jgi:serine/threonine protein phosphatase PrpC